MSSVKYGVILILETGFIVTFFVILAIVVLYRTQYYEPEPEIFNYKYTRFNSITNETSVGFVVYFQQLKEDEYVSFTSGNENMLISNFGSDEYTCRGSCTCEEERRSSRVLLGRALIYLVAAISSSVAYMKAGEYFESECKEQFSESCLKSSIKSSIDDCESQKNQLEKSKHDIQRFGCMGNCLTQKFKNKAPQEMANHYQCEKLIVRGGVELDCVDTPPEIMMKWVHSTFEKERMVPFCYANSRGTYYITKQKKSYWKDLPPNLTFTKSVNVRLCKGSPGKGDINPSIYCVQFPK